MKIIFKTLVLIAFPLLFFACKTAKPIKISGIPGTSIYNPDMTKIATIEENGSVEVKLKKNTYYAYLISNAPNSLDFVPFALDYKYYSYSGEKTAFIVGTTVSAIGTGALLGGSILAGLGETGTGLTMVGVGAGTLGLGLLPFAFVENVSKQMDYKYKYLIDQSTNNDVAFTGYFDKGVKKEIGVSKKLMSFNEGTAGTSNALSAALSNFKKSSTETKTYGQLVAGTYIGTGKIILDGKQVGLLENMRILIDNVDGKSVSVDVQDSKGEPCLGTKNLYDVKSPDGNTYTMSLIGNSDAVIRIDSNGSMEYIHPKVEVDANIFTLDIKASKK